jgi:hypothetical protein
MNCCLGAGTPPTRLWHKPRLQPSRPERAAVSRITLRRRPEAYDISLITTDKKQILDSSAGGDNFKGEASLENAPILSPDS